MQDWERLYFDDFDVWCERQIEALNRHKENLSADLDAERIAEEWQLMQRRERLDEFATPSLDPKLAAMLPEMYERAREPAKCELHDIGQISLGESMPHACPYTFEQILDEEWWPLWADPPEPAG